MQALEFLLSLAQKTGIGDGIAIGVRRELLQPDINPDLSARCHMLHVALGLHRKLRVVAISTLDDAHPLDLLDGEGCDLLFFVANEPKPSNATTISEEEMLSIGVDLPARLLVLY